MSLRRLRPDDATLWRALWAQAMAEAPGAFLAARPAAAPGAGPPATRPGAAPSAAAIAPRAFVWEEGGAALGCALWHRDPDAPEGGTGWIGAVYVLPAARGRGIAGRLIAALCADAAAAGMAELRLQVARDNAPARAAYARAGFALDPAAGCGDPVTLWRRLAP